ncbi:unnamed protein product [Xylocopa violacea]|uniref:Uncharacterized protein n=1 Tax=Xylocopa violacea TaxID=135666 RepID=A0ABP1N6M0_XYLVO
MHENIYYKQIAWHDESRNAPVLTLDAYIQKYERKFGKILSLKVLSRKQLKLLKLVRELIEAIEKEEIDKEQAFELLKTSNEAIRKTISAFQDSMKLCKESMRTEFAKVDCLSTNRLLSINFT